MDETERSRAQSQRTFFAHIQRAYGLSRVDYLALFRAQGGRCYVCRKAAGKARRLGVDHNHLTGEVRGLVCTGSLTPTTCNRLIAYYSRDALLRAAAMLSDPPPARAVLRAVRTLDWVPSLVGNDPFRPKELES